jgi:aminoglycoside 6-adenylyltransferase
VRSEAQMMALILGFAQEHESIRAVVMNGSRANPKAAKDPFQDYDIVYLVKDVADFRRKNSIPHYFGEPMIVQLPEDMGDPPPQGGDHYIYLMQFMDGTRIDLGIDPVSRAKKVVSDSLSVVLMDKDGLLGEIPPPSDSDYVVRSPGRRSFDDCCNEFWWLNIYVAKAIWRDQLPFAFHILEAFLRPQLVKMLGWHIVLKHGAPIALGKHGALLAKFLEPEAWEIFKGSYATADYAQLWNSLFAFGRLFRQAGKAVAAPLGYGYPDREDERVTDFIQRIKNLPVGATVI